LLHPNQFQINEAWILFRLNSTPIPVRGSGDFNCIALMDAASCFILGTDLTPTSRAEPTQVQFRHLLATGRSHKQQLPKTLFIPKEDAADRATREAKRHGIDVVRVAERELAIFIGEARQDFAEYLEEDSRDA
jgi:hypothetical protein